MIKFAILSFPGNNCEAESARAFRRNGMEAEIVLWNDPAMIDGTRCSEFSGYCIPGGFSYEDRSRSGVIAAQNPVLEVVKKEAAKGKVVIGICNGAQTLVETGLIPGFDNNDLAAGLAWNEMIRDGEVVDTGFQNTWITIRGAAPVGRSAFNDFEEVLKIPIAHGEGRFVFRDPAVLKALKENNQIIFQYCDESGRVSEEFPITPNGSTAAIAALCNPAGNVMAIMPHPERDPQGSGNLIFQSIRRWIENRSRPSFKSLGDHHTPEDVRPPEKADLEFWIRLIITDNAERTVEMTLKKKGFNVRLNRYGYWSLKLCPGVDKKEAALKIIESGELANLNKELVYVVMDEQKWFYRRSSGLERFESSITPHLVTFDHKNFVGDSKKSALNHHAGSLVSEMRGGVLWELENADQKIAEAIIRTKILYNPNSMYVVNS